MCGIVGLTGPSSPFIIGKMMAAISHRGPDACGQYHDSKNGVALGHVRLSILDIENGAQPMWSADSTVGIVFNGEIYNHLELRQDLTKLGYIFNSTHSDTEVLIHGYKEWGDSLPLKLNGMFAFCIYDEQEQKLFFARDRFGEKPLYYCLKNRNICFASEVSSILTNENYSSELSIISIQKFFGYGYIPAPNTLYRDIKKLPAGHFMKFDIRNGEISIKKYWEFSIKEDSKFLTRDARDVAEELKFLLDQSVLKRMIADVPVGIFLSGGIDSSSILAAATTNFNSRELETFTIGFNEKEFDESKKAKQVADYFGVNYNEKILTLDEARNEAMVLLEKWDEPIADSSILPTYMLCKYASKHVKVALSGDGSDELFAGYAPFGALNSASIYSRLIPSTVKKIIKYGVDSLPVGSGYFSFDFKLKRFVLGASTNSSLWNPLWMSPLQGSDISELLNIKTTNEEVFSEAIEAWENTNAKDLIGKTSEFYVRHYLQDDILCKVDRASMLSGLEVRAPFLDNDIVSFAEQLPSSLKFKNGNKKFILKVAMENSLPIEVLKSPKKGFSLPLTTWLKKWELPMLIDERFNNSFIKKLYQEHVMGAKDNRLFLWAWIVLSGAIMKEKNAK